MTEYKNLSITDKAKADKLVLESVTHGENINEYNGFKWIEPEYTLIQLHEGTLCAECLMIYYNCLCSHED